jgi:hemerythrin-like domain-containing protein
MEDQMPVASSRNASTDLIRIHKVITRALAISIQYSQEDSLEPAYRDGFLRYERALVSFLDAHHLSEEQVVFPFIEKKYPLGPFDLLRKHHQQIVLMLEKIAAWTENGPSTWEIASLTKLHETLVQLEQLWHTHISLEEQYLGPEMAAKILTPEEDIDLGNQIGAHVQKHALPAELVVPFMLYNLADDDRAVMAGGLPPVMTEQLIPFAWKSTWEPMLPFLLE